MNSCPRCNKPFLYGQCSCSSLIPDYIIDINNKLDEMLKLLKGQPNAKHPHA